MKPSAASLCALLLLGCAAAPSSPGGSAYNQGVAAYQAQDYAQAYAHWSEAAKDGDLNGINNLAYLINYGLGTAAEPHKAVALWQIAAQQGHSESQWHLGNAYADGQGVERDLATAYAWYKCAVETATRRARQSPEMPESKIADDARHSLAHLTDQLNGNELELGQALAAEYIDQFSIADTAAAPAARP